MKPQLTQMEMFMNMIKGIAMAEALALTVKEDEAEVIAAMKEMLESMDEDELLSYGLEQSIICVEEIDEIRDLKD